MSDHEIPGGGFADDIFGTFAYEPARPKKKTFLPWHHPRKQFVREHQWLSEIEALLESVSSEGRVLRYLGLPGDDLLDLRMFYSRICAPRQLSLKFLGFNRAASGDSTAQTELNISLDEVTKLSGVDSASTIMGDDFSRMANPESLAWRNAKALGPYDVVNLDLCDGFGRHVPGIFADNHYNALNQLLSLQARNKNSWLLLLTTRAGHNHIDVGVIERLLETYRHNLESCPPFKDGSSESFAIHDVQSLQSAAETAPGMLSVFLVGLSKWLLGLGLAQRPPTRVVVRSVICYRVVPNAPCEDLISIAFRFDPIFAPAADPLGLAGRLVSVPTECDLAVQALGKIARRRNADDTLFGDSDLFDRMVEATAALLELARYDPEEYRKWARAPQQALG